MWHSSNFSVELHDFTDDVSNTTHARLFSAMTSISFVPLERYCQQVLNETVRTAKLTPVAARLQGVEGKVDQHVIPKEVSACLLSPQLIGREALGIVT